MTLSMDVQSSSSDSTSNIDSTATIHNGQSSSSSSIPWQELGAKIRGSIHMQGQGAGESGDADASKTSPTTLAVARPECAMDVSHIVTFANTHNMTISAKSGGYNPSNWHSAGQIVIELERLNSIHMQHMKGIGSNNKGKRKEREPSPPAPSEERAPSRSSSSSSSSSKDGTTPTNGTPTNTHDPSPDLRSEPGSAPPPSASDNHNAGESSSSSDSPGANAATDVDMVDSSTISSNSNGNNKGKRRALDNYKAEGSSHHNSGAQQNENNDASSSQNKVLPGTYPPLYLGNKDPQQAKEIQDRYSESIKEKEASVKDGQNSSSGDARGAGTSSSSSSLASTSVPSLQPTAPGAMLMNLNTSGTQTINGRSSSYTSSSSSSSSPLYEHFGVQDPKGYVTVSFGAGIKAKDLDAHTSKYGYIVPLACYPVGTAIFITGGYGFVSRLFGLSMDLTTELEIVLPHDGSIYTLYSDYSTRYTSSPSERAKQEELWWCFRGAGTAFGIVTRITAKAYKIGKVLSGNLIFPYNSITTPSLLKHWRDCWKLAPRELYSNFALTAGPTAAGHVVVVQFSWCGARQSDGETLLQNFLSWDGERCLLKDIEVRPFSHQQDNVSQILSSKDDSRWLVRSTLINSLTDDAIHKTVDLFKSATAGTSWLLELSGGAIAEPEGPTCFPISHRKAPFQTAALHQWSVPGDDLINKEMAEKWIYGVLGSTTPTSTSTSTNATNGDSTAMDNNSNSFGPFPCFLGSGEGRERIIQIYGGETPWKRLKELKLKYDKKGLLKYTHFEDELLK